VSTSVSEELTASSSRVGAKYVIVRESFYFCTADCPEIFLRLSFSRFQEFSVIQYKIFIQVSKNPVLYILLRPTRNAFRFGSNDFDPVLRNVTLIKTATCYSGFPISSKVSLKFSLHLIRKSISRVLPNVP